MGLILDENLPLSIRDEIKDIQGVNNVLDVDEGHKGILDFELVDLMDEEDILVTGDLELHRNMIKIGKKSVYYDIQRNNILEVQVKIAYYLMGYDKRLTEFEGEPRVDAVSNPNTQLRKRFDEVKKENAELKVRINVLEGKLKSVLNTAQTALED
ncbi:MAG: hypothetical protein R6U17_10110 [Thermoplasmata archaeon]